MPWSRNGGCGIGAWVNIGRLSSVEERTLRTLISVVAIVVATMNPLVALAAKKAAAEKPAAQGSAEQQRPFVTVNGVAVPEIDARIAIVDRRAAGAADSPALQNAVRNQLVARELFAQQARKQGLDKNAVLQARARMAKEELLARAYEEDYLVKHPVGDEQLRKEYDGIKARSGDKEFLVRHIMLASEDEAKGVITRLRGGENFQSLAALSKDEGSRARGGELGWRNASNLPPQLAEAAAKLAKGQTTQQPVKGPVGWHVLLVEDTRPFTMPPYDDKIKGQLRQALARQALTTHLAELLKSAKVE
jgi:peptidyl-prolyl cis-trans isomerase C